MYALYLNQLKLSRHILGWEYESKTFWFEKIRRGTRSYTPDFEVTFGDGRIEYHEIKGWMDARSRTKIKRMAKYYPRVTLRVFGSDWFKKNMSSLTVLESVNASKQKDYEKSAAGSADTDAGFVRVTASPTLQLVSATRRRGDKH
jgi:hypothetical protein